MLAETTLERRCLEMRLRQVPRNLQLMERRIAKLLCVCGTCRRCRRCRVRANTRRYRSRQQQEIPLSIYEQFPLYAYELSCILRKLPK